VSPLAALRADPAFDALRAVSARLGADPLQVQGPGGNTSLKRDGAMWIKASGVWLAEAEAREAFVPVDLDALRAAIAAEAPGAEKAEGCVPAAENPASLRPSIETTVHAVLPAPVVLHTHCVATIATAIRTDGEAVVAARLGDLGAVWIPYVMPGLRLAQEIARRAPDGAPILVLGGHGLVACGDTAQEAEARLRMVSTRLEPASPGREATPPSKVGPGYVAPDAPATHGLACDPARLAIARRGAFYPDHVVFLGRGVATAEPDEPAEDAARRLGRPVLLMLPGRGAAIRADASAGAQALAKCLGDVFRRIDAEAPVTPLPEQEVDALANWDAEAYRRSLDAAR
jgi:rhamnose utilization protein RhaD (predicted bifunctional aldolase and dehydrogenase)